MKKIIFFISLIMIYPARAMTPKEVYEKAGKGVVMILAQGEGLVLKGTGSLIRKDGYVITNAHVVYDFNRGEIAKNIYIYLKPETLSGDVEKDLGKKYAAALIHYNRILDLALLKIENPPAKINVIDLVNPDDFKIGEPVVAIGHPEDAGLWSLTTGIISAEIASLGGVEGREAYQTQTSLNRGNSGGPLLNSSGDMIGINTSVSRLAADGFPMEGINYAIKSNVIKKWLDRQGVEVSYAFSSKTEGKTAFQFDGQEIAQKRPYKISSLDSLIEEKLDELEKELLEFRKK